MADTEADDPERDKWAMQIGKRSTVKVAYTLEFVVEDVEMTIDGDVERMADEELFIRNKLPKHGERDLIHSEELESEPIYEDEMDLEDLPDAW